MSTGPAPEEYPQLPGPARFINDVVTDLSEGKSVVIVFPDALVESGVAEAILEEVAREGANAEFCHASSDPLPTRIITTFGVDVVAHREFDEWDTIVNWEPWHGAWVLLPGWEHDDLDEITDRWPAQLQVCGLAIADRPRLILAARLSELSRATIAHLDRATIAVHWWWGVLDRLDTETRLAAVGGRSFNPVENAVITELASWDLALVDHLTTRWDRTASGVEEAIESFSLASAPNPVVESTGSAPRRACSAPPVELEEQWRTGVVDQWGHQIRWATYILDDSRIQRLLWLAHNRTLMLHVDEERVHYEAMLLPKAAPHVLEGLWRRVDDIIEIGSLAWLVETGRVDVSRAHRTRLSAFRDLRNLLAHRTPVDDRLMKQIAGYLEF